MEIKLIIKATKDEDTVNVLGKEYSFKDLPKITIGRGAPNDVPLLDSARTVSRNHAQLVEVAGGYALKDLGSKNFSYVNDDKVSVESPKKLTSGDVIRIGEFAIEFLFAAKKDLDRTVFDPIGTLDFNVDNPFSEPVQELMSAWKQLTALYDANSLSTKSDYLTHALKQELPAIEQSSVMSAFVNVLPNTSIREQRPAPTPISLEETVNRKPPSAEAPVGVAPSPYIHTSDSAGIVLDATLEMLKELIRIPYEFRGEFIGHTMWQDEESTFLYEGDYEVTKKYLLGDNSETEIRRKLERFKKAAKKVKLHQVGMMEGYMAVVKESLDKVLKEIDPTQIGEKEVQGGFLNKAFPALASQKVLEVIEEKISSFKLTDWGALEQRMYRPIFIRAYMLSTGKEE